MGVSGVFTQIVHSQIKQRSSAGSSEQTFRTEAVDERREDREHIDAHAWHRLALVQSARQVSHQDKSVIKKVDVYVDAVFLGSSAHESANVLCSATTTTDDSA